MRQSSCKGIYTPINPAKYKGKNINKISFRSSWELSMNQFLDNNPNILEWASECVIVPYLKPTTGRIHKYYVDYWVKYKNKHGVVVTELWEVKPKAQTVRPTTRGKKKKTQVYESITYEVNKAKWSAATAFCNKYGMKFRLVTELSIFGA